MVQPLDAFGQDRWVAKKLYPFEIKPRSSEKVFSYLGYADLPGTVQGMRSEKGFLTHLKVSI